MILSPVSPASSASSVDSSADSTRHSSMISSEESPRFWSVFSCIRRITSSWLSDPPLTPIRTAFASIPRDLTDRRELLVAPAAGSDVAGVDPVLVEGIGAGGVAREQQVSVVVEVADDRHVAAASTQAPLDLGNRRRGFGQVDRDAHQLGPGLRKLQNLP